jgi:hypothetical protein
VVFSLVLVLVLATVILLFHKNANELSRVST